MSGACPVFGFTVHIGLRDGVDRSVRDSIANGFAELLDANGMGLADGTNRLDFVVNRDGTQATDADRQLVLAWAQQWKREAAFEVSDLIDLSAAD